MQDCKLLMESGHLPSSLTTAVLSRLLNRYSLDYRPISNLKVIFKIMETILAVPLQDYLESNQLNEPLQSAYKRFHSHW